MLSLQLFENINVTLILTLSLFTAGDDFQSVVNLPLVLSSGEQQSQQASIDIVDDTIRDDREMFRVLISLLSSNGSVRIPTGNASTDILIMDNDPPNTGKLNRTLVVYTWHKISSVNGCKHFDFLNSVTAVLAA